MIRRKIHSKNKKKLQNYVMITYIIKRKFLNQNKNANNSINQMKNFKWKFKSGKQNILLQKNLLQKKQIK